MIGDSLLLFRAQNEEMVYALCFWGAKANIEISKHYLDTLLHHASSVEVRIPLARNLGSTDEYKFTTMGTSARMLYPTDNQSHPPVHEDRTSQQCAYKESRHPRSPSSQSWLAHRPPIKNVLKLSVHVNGYQQGRIPVTVQIIDAGPVGYKEHVGFRVVQGVLQQKGIPVGILLTRIHPPLLLRKVLANVQGGVVQQVIRAERSAGEGSWGYPPVAPTQAMAPLVPWLAAAVPVLKGRRLLLWPAFIRYGL